MKRAQPKQSAHEKLNRMLLWSIRNQDRLARYVRWYLSGVAVIVMLICAGGLVSFSAALEIIFYSALTFLIGLALFIFKRRSWLLGITDLDLKREAHAAMLAYISARETPSQSKRTVTSDPCEHGNCQL